MAEWQCGGMKAQAHPHKVVRFHLLPYRVRGTLCPYGRVHDRRDVLHSVVCSPAVPPGFLEE